MLDASNEDPPLPSKTRGRHLSFNIKFFTDESRNNSLDFQLNGIDENQTVRSLKDAIVSKYKTNLTSAAKRMGLPSNTGYLRSAIYFEGMQNSSDFHDSVSIFLL